MIINGNNGFDYRINFRYDRLIDDNKSVRGRTYCTVEKVEAGGRFNEEGLCKLEGKSTCDSRDTFCKKTGRKLALTRALTDTENSATEFTANGNALPKDERKIVWEGYLSQIS